MGGSLALWDVDARPKEPPELTIVRTFLRPVDLPALGIHRDADAPFGRIEAIGVAAARLHERLDARAIEVRAHDAHAFAIRPVQLAGRLLDVQLLGSEGRALGNDDLAIATIEVGPLDVAVVQVRDAHVGPVDVTCLDVHGDAVRPVAAGHDDLAVGAVRIQREHAPPAEIEEEQATGGGLAAGTTSRWGDFGSAHRSVS